MCEGGVVRCSVATGPFLEHFQLNRDPHPTGQKEKGSLTFKFLKMHMLCHVLQKQHKSSPNSVSGVLQ